MGEEEINERIEKSRELILLTLRRELGIFFDKVKMLPIEDKKTKDLNDFELSYLFDWSEEYIDSGVFIEQENAFKIIIGALNRKHADAQDSPKGTSGDQYRLFEKIRSCLEFCEAYKEELSELGTEYTLLPGKGAKIVDLTNGGVQYSFDAESGKVIDNTKWDRIPESTRKILSDYIVFGFIKNELVAHQIDLRQQDGRYITLDKFVSQYRELKSKVDSGEKQVSELDSFVAQYVQDEKDDVVLLTEENIEDILGFCKEEIQQDDLEPGEKICGEEDASAFIRDLLVRLKSRLEVDGESQVKLEKIDKYIEFFEISDGIGLRKNNNRLGVYAYGNFVDTRNVFYYIGDWEFSIKRDGYGIDEGAIDSYEIDEIKALDDKRIVPQNDSTITVEDYLKKKIAKGVVNLLRQEIILRQIKIREKQGEDTAFLFEDEIVLLSKLEKMYIVAKKENRSIDRKINNDVKKILSFRGDLLKTSEGDILLSEDNVDELLELVSEAMQRYDYSDEDACRSDSGSLYNFVRGVLENYKNQLLDEPDTDEIKKKIERIDAYKEYVRRTHYRKLPNVEIDDYVYHVGKNGNVGFRVELTDRMMTLAYEMKDGYEYSETGANILVDKKREVGYLRDLDRNRANDISKEQSYDAEKNRMVAEVGTTRMLCGIFSRDSLRKVYGDSRRNKRQEFKQMMKHAIEYFENQR